MTTPPDLPDIIFFLGFALAAVLIGVALMLLF